MRRALTTLAFALALAGSLGACHKAGAQDAPPAAVAAETAKGAAFLAKNAKAPGVVVLPSGLQYKVVKSGPADGPHPQRRRRDPRALRRHAARRRRCSTRRSRRGQPAVMPLAHLVPGWMEALPLMRPGDEWILYVPASLAYGDEGAGPTCPPGATLVFRLQLLGVLPRAADAMG